MFCMKCQHDVLDCMCPDIEARLRSLAECNDCIAPAAKINLEARKRAKALDDLPVAGHA